MSVDNCDHPTLSIAKQILMPSEKIILPNDPSLRRENPRITSPRLTRERIKNCLFYEGYYLVQNFLFILKLLEARGLTLK